jgi:disulfide bond formation protein DsbB
MKKLLLVLSVALALVLFAAACGGDDDDGASSDTTEAPSDDGDGDGDGDAAVGDAAAGATVFSGTCAACHGEDAEGIDGLGKPLADSDFVADTSSAELIVVVTDGRAVDDPANTTGILMPPKGGNPALTDEDIANVVSYIKSLN